MSKEKKEPTGKAPAKGSDKGPKAKKAKVEKGPKGKSAGPKKVAKKDAGAKKDAAKSGAKKTETKAKSWRINFPLYEKRPKNFSIGNDILPKRDLTRFVKWPKYIRVQRQKRILQERLKVPPAIAQFKRTLSLNQTVLLYHLLHKYRPESHLEKLRRLKKLAQAKAKNQPVETFKRPLSIIAGISAVTSAVESGRAKLVAIAHDVDPLEVVLWLPTLLRKKDIPYCIVKSRSRLGQLVRRKGCAVVAFPEPRKEDKTALAHLVELARKRYNDNVEHRRKWGGGKLGPKARARIIKQKKLIKKEAKLRALKPAIPGK